MIPRVLVTCLLLTAPPRAGADDLSELLLRVPGDMNTVAVINVRAINQTPRAAKEKWRDSAETEYLAGQSIKRFVEPQEVADLCLFLASPAASMITGQAIGVDGHTEAYHL